MSKPMSDFQFKGILQHLENTGGSAVSEQLRARDTAQREALARAEAERDLLLQHNNGRIAEERDALTVQLAEAVGLLREVKQEPSCVWVTRLDAFLARHAQADQQKAQGAQAGDELERLSVSNILLDVVPGPDGMGHEVYAKSVEQVERRLCDLGGKVEDLTNELSMARAALATQPGEWVDPVALYPAENLYNQGFADGVAEAKRLNAVRGAEHDQ